MVKKINFEYNLFLEFKIETFAPRTKLSYLEIKVLINLSTFTIKIKFRNNLFFRIKSRNFAPRIKLQSLGK